MKRVLKLLRSALVSLFALFALPALAGEPLHVLFITLDDMNRDSVGVYGCKVPDTTPHIDALAREGLRFEHGHVSIAICQPTRAVWMTGRYPHNSGALGFNPIKPGIPTLPETLKASGYLTGILGKTEHVVPSRKTAFDYQRDRRDMENGRSADLYASFAAEFFAKAKTSGKPFFFMVNTHDPHRPFDNREPAAERTRSLEGLSTSQRKKPYPLDYPAPSRIYQPAEITVPGFLPDLPKIREEIAQYYSSVRRADDVVGRVLAELKKAGFKGRTLVMLKSDHGIPVPFAKTNVWQHSTRVPWIIRWPGVLAAHTIDQDHVVAGVDFAPTILETLGLPPMAGMDGRSFLPVLKGQSQDKREQVYTHINTIASGRDFTMRSLAGKRYGLIFNAWSDGETLFKNESMAGLTYKAMAKAAEEDESIAARVRHYRYRTPFEFYDYQRDPDALDNVFDSPAHQDLIATHHQMLADVMRRYKDPALGKYKAARAALK